MLYAFGTVSGLECGPHRRVLFLQTVGQGATRKLSKGGKQLLSSTFLQSVVFYQETAALLHNTLVCGLLSGNGIPQWPCTSLCMFDTANIDDHK